VSSTYVPENDNLAAEIAKIANEAMKFKMEIKW